MTSSSDIAEPALDLAWSLWSELGVRGAVEQRHGDWSIDPEPLIAFTARQGDRDPRLRDETLDWCIQNERFVSRARLRGVLGRADPHTRSAFGGYAATLAEHTGRAWPQATEPWPYRPTGRSRIASLSRPALIRVRLRAIFGVGARAEILHAFVAAPQARMTTAQLARLTSYTKRNVAEELAARAGWPAGCRGPPPINSCTDYETAPRCWTSSAPDQRPSRTGSRS